MPRHFKRVVTLVCSVVVSIAALLYFLPRESRFGYHYEVNKPWRYAQLIAAYDFPLLKTDAEIQRERDSLSARFEPYYTYDSLTAKQQVAAFRAAYAEGKLGSLPPRYLPRLLTLLDAVSRRGIIDAGEQDNLLTNEVARIRLVRGTESVPLALDQCYTTRTAYEYINTQALAAGVPRDVLQQCRLNTYLQPTLRPDARRSCMELDGELARVLPNCGMVWSGQLIIDRGQIVTPDRQRVLDSLKRENEQRMNPTHGFWLTFAGQFIFIAGMVAMLLLYLKLFRRDYFASPHTVLLLFSLVTAFPLLTYLMVTHHFFSVYLIPYAIVPIFVRIFMDSRSAFVAVVITALLSALALHSQFEFVLLQLVTGMTAIYSLRELTERAQLLRTVTMVVFVGLLFSVAFDLSQGISAGAFDTSRALYLVIGGVLLLFAYPLMYLVEKLFGFTSSVTLVELTNTNHPLLRRMSKEAQGTFNHSMQVANLAAEVADKIGAKPQLARTGALFHDIGKLESPAFFTENQSGVNPHDRLDEVQSARIITAHVTEGLRLAEKYHLPSVIRDFIRTHHGRGLAKYFYLQCVAKHPDEQVDPALFQYPGPNPHTREQAVLMMCDAVEAASRSLKAYTEESLRELVDRIIDGQLAEGYFRECPLTFRDVADAKRVLVDSLKTVYHTRIAYPTQQPSAPRPAARPGLFGTGLHRTWSK